MFRKIKSFIKENKGLVALYLSILLIALTVLPLLGSADISQSSYSSPAYVDKLFDDSQVQQIDILMDETAWQSFLEDARSETYILADIVINGETFHQVGLRTKGNNSLDLTERYGSYRFSLKLKFNQFIANQTYYGLDELALNASFQDNSYLKEIMTYDMMAFMQVPTPLVSYAFVTVSGRDWGLYVAIEEPDRAFALRNFGPSYGALYKPAYKRRHDPNDDVALIYTDDAFESYDNIFRKARYKVSDADKARLIASLKHLDSGENLDEILDIDELLRFFTVQVFVVNLDSYLGPTGHNYFLYESEGVLRMLPWDYNLAYATYALGMPNPINDAALFVNYPINTPAWGEVMLRRPMFHNVMQAEGNLALYHQHFDQLISDYFESGLFDEKIAAYTSLIDPYVQRDPTRFVSYDKYQTAVRTFQDFGIARSQSIRAQLEGRLPATIRGQSEDKSQFIDASHISIPAIGNMRDMRVIRDSQEPIRGFSFPAASAYEVANE